MGLQIWMLKWMLTELWKRLKKNYIFSPEKLGYYELKDKPWFHEESSKLLDQRKYAKLRWSGKKSGHI
jgi:hypothetical protein